MIPNGVEPVFTPDGARAEGDYVLAVGTLEPRKNLGVAQRGRARPGRELRVVGARGWGGVEVERLARSRLRRGAGGALPRRALPRLPVAVRGLRDPGARGDGLRDAGRDERGRRDRGGRRRRRPCSSTRATRSRSRPGSRRRSRGATSSSRSGSSARGVHVGAGRRGRRGGLRGGARDSAVAIDADVLGRHRTGDETYVENLLRRLPALGGGELRFAAITRQPELVPEGVEPFELHGADAAAADGAGVPAPAPSATSGARPLPARAAAAVPCPAVVTVHDLSFERDATAMAGTDRLVFRRVVPRVGAAGAAHVIAVSERTKRDLIHLYGVPPERITVTPHGVDPAFAPRRGRVRTTTSSSSARSRRARTRSRRRRPPRPSACRSSSSGPERDRPLARELGGRGADPARLRRAGRARRGSTAARPRSSSRRATRASACPCSRRWRAGRPSSPRTTPLSTRSPATRPSTPDDELAERDPRRPRRPRPARRRRPRARQALQLGRDRRGGRSRSTGRRCGDLGNRRLARPPRRARASRCPRSSPRSTRSS